MMRNTKVFMLFSIFSICLAVLPITVEASRNSTIQVTGKLDTVEEESTVDSSKNEIAHLDEKETIIKEGSLPITGEQSNTVEIFIGLLMFLSVIVIYLDKRKKTT